MRLRLIAVSVILLYAAQASAAELLDITRAVVVAPASAGKIEKKAVAMLIEEVERRTQTRWRVSAVWPADGSPVIAIVRAANLRAMSATHAALLAPDGDSSRPEGYRLRVITTGSPAVLVAGN